PKEKAVACVECHTSNGRLEKIDGLYIPGRGSDQARWLEIGGWLAAALTLLGVAGHGLIRVITSQRNR
ncbi:MAG: tetrathionate reductase family octaheme c-type cytochrome, partial [Rhodoferax sp.]